jgi:hypothetical protein
MITAAILKKAITNVTNDPVRAIELHYPRIMALSLLSTHDDSMAMVAEELTRLTSVKIDGGDAPMVINLANDSTLELSGDGEPMQSKEAQDDGYPFSAEDLENMA